jgi:hypothetical protein
MGFRLVSELEVGNEFESLLYGEIGMEDIILKNVHSKIVELLG